MAHFTVLVLLPLNTENFEQKVKDLLYPYYSELEVEPYRQYLDRIAVEEEVKQLLLLSEEDLARLALDWEVPSKNLEAIAKLRLDWDEEEVMGNDEHGAYRFSTINPYGKWDSYTLLDGELTETGKITHYPCRARELPEVIPYAVITPDGKWYEVSKDIGIQAFARTHLHHDMPISEEEIIWNLKVKAIITQYQDHFVMGLNCHL
ncbi:hypothetical protein [Coleofasciculus sp. FACHB-129]|uniref:hypothetical protein n=1 Tax=Cyanophyceae TaxID=3028117 RepID=UPI0016838D46|nr:hypothetical protein [Coleofasciculus sp. FACHB-129]MBD1893112.1 hypothetical protein [Coleofasciculus sp. FACHB-129]